MSKIYKLREWLARKIRPPLVTTATEIFITERLANIKVCNTGCRTAKCVKAPRSVQP